MRSKLLTMLFSICLAFTVSAEGEAPTDPVHLACGSSSAPRAVAVGTRVQLGSYATEEAAMAAAADPAIRNQLRELMAQTVLAYSTCDDCPPGSSRPRCPGTYRGVDFQAGDLEYAIVRNPDGTFAVGLEAMGAFSYSLGCGLCPPRVD